MNNFFQYLVSTITRQARRLAGLFPTSLPQGGTEFDAWSARIVSTWTLPTTDVDTIQFMLGSMLIHLGPQTDRKSDYYFVRSIRAAAAKQVGGAKFHEVKLRQLEAQKAAQDPAKASPTKSSVQVHVSPAEATALQPAASNGPQK